MKTKLFILAILMGFSCTNKNRPITETEKERVVGEVKGLITTII
jgi:hypothetical protein